jgi:hypothetical protein
MKTWPIIIGIIVILALLYSPTLAIISKSDLISYYNQTNPIRIPTPTPTQTPLIPSVWSTPTPVPSSGKSLFPSWFVPSCWEIPQKENTLFTRPSIYPTPTPTPSPVPNPPPTGCGYASCPPAIPVGYLQHTFCKCMSYRNVITGEVVGEECINPETGQSYPIGMDALGNSYLVKPGCPARWVD